MARQWLPPCNLNGQPAPAFEGMNISRGMREPGRGAIESFDIAEDAAISFKTIDDAEAVRNLRQRIGRHRRRTGGSRPRPGQWTLR